MHNIGKDLHVNVAGDIFYTGGATFQLKLTKDFNAKSRRRRLDRGRGQDHAQGREHHHRGLERGHPEGRAARLVNLAGAGVDIVGSMVKVNSGGGGAGGAARARSDKAKKEDSITPEKKSDYDKTFDDPLPEADGGTGANKSKAS